MKNFFRKSIAVILIALFLMTMLPMTVFANGEDFTPPELISVEILTPRVKAGESAQIRIEVQEDGTGLKSVGAGFHREGTISGGYDSLRSEKSFDVPLNSSENKNIVVTLDIPTNEYSINGKWFIYAISLCDSKGNSSTVHSFDKSLYIELYGSAATDTKPVLNSIELLTEEVETRKDAKFRTTITQSIKNARFDFSLEIVHEKGGSSGETEIGHGFSVLSDQNGRMTYSAGVSIPKNARVGVWRLNRVTITDTLGNTQNYKYYAKGESGVLRSDDGKQSFEVPRFTVYRDEITDTVAPNVKSVKVLNKDKLLSKPGVLHVEVELEEYETEIMQVDINVRHMGPDKHEKSHFGQTFYSPAHEWCDNRYLIGEAPIKSGKYRFKVAIPSIGKNGTYRVSVGAVDKAGNDYGESIDPEWGYREPVLVYDEFTLVDEFDYDFEVSISSSTLASKVKAMEEGKVGRVLLSSKRSNNVLKKEVLDALAGKDKKLVCYRDGYQWIFDGKNINKNKTKDLNLTAEIIKMNTKNLKNDHSVVCADFENNGELPGKVQFRFKTEYVKYYLGLESKLWFYHLDQKNKNKDDIDFIADDFDLVPRDHSNMKVVHDGDDSWCYVDISHNSKYVLSDSKIEQYDLEVIGLKSSYPYTGTSVNPEPTVKLDGKTLKPDTDYRLLYNANNKIGTNARVIIQGLNKYQFLGNYSLYFTINPAKPTNVKATSAGYNSIKVSWNKAAGVDGYEVYSATSKSGTYSYFTSTKNLSVTNGSRITGKTYYYKVRAYKTVNGKKQYGSFSSVVSAKAVPAKPTNIKASSAGYNSVKISWNKVTGATGYAVYHATSKSGTYKLLTRTTKTSITNSKLTTGKTYYYKVKAYRTVNGERIYGSLTGYKSAKPIPATPSITAKNAGSKKIKLSWKQVSGASGYEVYRATSKSGSYSKVTTITKGSTVSYTNSKLTKGKTYYYKVRAYRTVSGKKVYGSYSSVKYAKG